MAVVSCANWQAGWFTAYRHLAKRQDLDLVLHLGDYLYEYAPGEYQARDVVVRPHDPPREMTTLADYRRRHAQYKTDPDLQALHAVAPWVVTWDDHESANDAWRDGAENHTPGAEGEWRRAGRSRNGPTRSGCRCATRPAAGSTGGCASVGWPTCRCWTCGPTATSRWTPRSTRRWTTRPARSPAASSSASCSTAWPTARSQWKLVGNPVMITPVRFPNALDTRLADGVAHPRRRTRASGGGVPYNVDQWDGYPVERAKVLGHLGDRGIRDALFLTGDIHSGWACDLPIDGLTYPVTGASVGVELVCTSVTSDNLDDITRTPPRTSSLAVETAFKATNPHIKYLDFDSHGFSVLEVTPAGAQMDWYVLTDRTDPNAAAIHSVSYRVPAGTQRSSRPRGGSREPADDAAGPAPLPPGRRGRWRRRRAVDGGRCASRPSPRGARPSGSTCSSWTAPTRPRSSRSSCRSCEAAPRGHLVPNARSLPVMETIPNHVMMMTGVRPDRSGVPANAIFDRARGRRPRPRPALRPARSRR